MTTAATTRPMILILILLITSTFPFPDRARHLPGAGR